MSAHWLEDDEEEYVKSVPNTTHMLPCPFCGHPPEVVTHNGYGDKYSKDTEYGFGTPFTVRCRKDTSKCTAQPYGNAGISVECAIKNWNTRCVGGHVVTFHHEIAGVICPTDCWVVCAEGYMYGPCENWQDVERRVINEWKNDRNMVG